MERRNLARWLGHAATRSLGIALGCFCLAAVTTRPALAQATSRVGKLREPFVAPDLGERYSPKLDKVLTRRISPESEKRIIERRTEILEFRSNVYRVAVADDNVADYIQYDPKTIGLIGRERGETTFTVWLEDEEQPVHMIIKVIQDPETVNIQRRDYSLLEQHIAEFFPNSHVRLIPVADKLVVWGQAASAEEAATIISILTSGGGGNQGQNQDDVDNRNNTNVGAGGRGSLAAGAAAPVFPGATEQLPALTVINMLRVPGEHQVMLKVKVAELNRSALRDIGVDFSLRLGTDDRIFLQSLLSGGAGNLNMTFDAEDVMTTIRFLAGNGTARILSEPTITVLSGQTASFLAGGEFAVPTAIVGGGGVAATTQFRGFGVSLFVFPVVIDRDRIRLTITPEFSQVSGQNAVNGVPGLSTRTLSTTIELREGQTYALGGLIEDSIRNDNSRVPYLGDVPILGTIFRTSSSTHNERELVILITPEIVSPMEPDEVPPLPGYDVTEPTDFEFYFKGRTEGHAGSAWRSTTWPINWTRTRDRIEAQRQYVAGPSGHSLPSVQGTAVPGGYGYGSGPQYQPYTPQVAPMPPAQWSGGMQVRAGLPPTGGRMNAPMSSPAPTGTWDAIAQQEDYPSARFGPPPATGVAPPNYPTNPTSRWRR
jgi:pilus assembly protein CpaC